MATQGKYSLMLYLYKEDKKTDKINWQVHGIGDESIVISQNTWTL